jgi:hypothetical protein
MITTAVRVLLLGGLLLLSTPLARADDPADGAAGTLEAQAHLRAALAAISRKETAAAQTEILAAIADPGFEGLAEAAQRIALATAGSLALQSDNPDQAQQFARRATALPGASIDDWQLRLSASMKLHDSSDAAIALTAIARGWGRDARVLPDGTVARVLSDTRVGSLNPLRFDLLEALYDTGWRASTEATASPYWRDLACLLLARGDKEQAIQVASHIDRPFDVIGLHADARLRPLLSSSNVPSDVRATMRALLERQRMRVKDNPRSLRALNVLLSILLENDQYAEVLRLSDAFANSADETDSYAYEDLMRERNWTLDRRAHALLRLGRTEEAVAELRQAAALPNRVDQVSQPINLAELLCELGRPEEALAALPDLSDGTKAAVPDASRISGYGLMQVASVRLTAAVELGRTEQAAEALAYLRAHREDSPSTLQYALLRAGETTEAAQVLLARLADEAQRTTTLIELQVYASEWRPPLAAQWHQAALGLVARTDVQRAVHQVGRIDRYEWLGASNE